MLLEVAGLRKTFGSVVAADDIDLVIAPGEAVGIIGPNGAGKTTLFNLIAGDLVADAGSIRFDGRDLAACRRMDAAAPASAAPIRSRSRSRSSPCSRTCWSARSMAAASRSARSRNACGEILERLGLLKRANAPAGSLTLLERKRLEMARALATAPRLLLLDEIAGGLTEGECLRARRDHPRHPRDRRHHRLDRACRACAARRGRSAGRAQFRPQDRRGRAAGGDAARPRCARSISASRRERCRCWKPAALTAFYGDFQALYGIDTTLDSGETIAIIGANGAGKSTFLKSIAGLIPRRRRQRRARRRADRRAAAAEIVKLGIALVPEGRRLFPSLTVEENLLIGGYGRKMPGRGRSIASMRCFRSCSSGALGATPTLSGGQQQMAAIGRALMSNPRILLCDEISLGLAPIIIADIYAALPQIKAEGTSVVLVEQDIVQAMKVADRVYCFQEGRLSLAGRPRDLTREQIHRAYFGS